MARTHIFQLTCRVSYRLLNSVDLGAFVSSAEVRTSLDECLQYLRVLIDQRKIISQVLS